MKTQDVLDQLRQGLAGCDLAAFGDLQSKLILRTSSKAPYPRETLDSIAETATVAFAAMTPGELDSKSDPLCLVSFAAGRTVVFACANADLTCVVLSAAEDISAALPVVSAAARDLSESTR